VRDRPRATGAESECDALTHENVSQFLGISNCAKGALTKRFFWRDEVWRIWKPEDCDCDWDCMVVDTDLVEYI
jgi:hypothetical protein